MHVGDSKVTLKTKINVSNNRCKNVIYNDICQLLLKTLCNFSHRTVQRNRYGELVGRFNGGMQINESRKLASESKRIL